MAEKKSKEKRPETSAVCTQSVRWWAVSQSIAVDQLPRLYRLLQNPKVPPSDRVIIFNLEVNLADTSPAIKNIFFFVSGGADQSMTGLRITFEIIPVSTKNSSVPHRRGIEAVM